MKINTMSSLEPVNESGTKMLETYGCKSTTEFMRVFRGIVASEWMRNKKKYRNLSRCFECRG